MSTAKKPQQKSSEVVKQEPKVSFVQKVIGGDTYLVMADSALALEDEFSNLYYTANGSSTNVFLLPPYDPKTLARLVSQNNILSQCIEAMEVNIDSTGYELLHVEEGKDVDENEKKVIESFMAEPYPGKSFQTLRRKMRRDLESVGYAFFEVLRNMGGDIVALRNIDSHTVRFVKLDAPVQVKKTLMRGGQEIELTMWERERRFGVLHGSTRVFFREFGTTREINRDTGEWETPDNKVPLENRGTELLCFNVNPDTTSPYGVPRWINQLPSVVGSRKAEEHNLEYFDAGGMPPALLFVQGGMLVGDAAEQLRNYLSGKNKNRNRAVVVEVQSASGSLESAGRVDVKVERFGAEMSKDAMFQQYDKNTEEHVRTGFRLPPLFVGKAADYNYATAVVAYMVAEAQVFSPERNEFDEMMNKTILKGLGIKNTRFKSKPITLKNATDQIAALTLIKDMVPPADLIEQLNVVAGTTLQFDQEAADRMLAKEEEDAKRSGELHTATVEKMRKETEQIGKEPAKGTAPPAATKPKKISKADMLELAHHYCGVQGLVALKTELTEEEALSIADEIEKMDREELQEFQTMVANFVFETNTPEAVAACVHG